MSACDLPDHFSHLRAVERRERNNAVVRAQAPGRAEFRPRRRDDEKRRLRAALGERAQEIERGRVGPVQVFEGEHDRLRSRARQNPGRHRRQLPAPQFLRREFRPRSSGSGTSTSGASRGAYSAASRPISRKVFSRSASVCSSDASAPPKRSRAPFGERVQGRVLQELRGGPFDPGVRRLGELCRGIPRSGATCRCRARRRSGRTGLRLRARATSGAVSSASSSSRPTSGVRARAPPRRPPPLARTMR